MEGQFRVRLDQLEENPVALREAKTDDKQYVQLKDSIRKEGVILPVAVCTAFLGDGKSPRTTDDGRPVYRIVDGLQRYTASKELGINDIPVIVHNADDARVERMQVIANYQRVPTKFAELSSHINRIMGRDPTASVTEFASSLGLTEEYMKKVLSIDGIKNPSTLAAIDAGKITVSNAADLARLSPEDQDKFVQDAISDNALVFSGKVKQRIKEVRDAKRAARDPNQEPSFTWEPHLRSKTEIVDEIANPSTISTLLKAAGVSDPTEAAVFTLKWATRQDQQSVDAARAKFDAKKAERDAENLRKKAERDAQRARESAAAAAGK